MCMIEVKYDRLIYFLHRMKFFKRAQNTIEYIKKQVQGT